MACQKCTSVLLSRWDHEVRAQEVFCPCCSWRPAYAVPVPVPPVSANGRPNTEMVKPSLHVCKCGWPKVPWRSRCRGCLDRKLEYEQKRLREQKAIAVQAVRKAFA